ncbi:MAG: hypothetical protein HWD59_04390 [Coxiellaceae bacterium]|nr:MAG: hypothetical protein HWD59_04390 [Coxiellaceae bacterium]
MPSPNHSKEQLQNYLVAICELADLVANQYQSSEIQELLCESYASQNISSKMVKQEFLRDFEK